MPNTPTDFDQALAGETSWAATLGIPDGILEVYALLGSQYYENGLIEDARTMFNAVVALNANSHLGYAGLGALELVNGDAEAARLYLEKAYARFPQDIVVCGNLGESLVRLGHPRDAARFLREAAALDPAETDPYANRARAILAALPND